MKARFILFFTLLFLFGPVRATAAPKWFDQSHEIFLPRALNSQASTYRDFPLFWWNFLILDGQLSPAALESLCTQLAGTNHADIQKLPCHFDLKDLQELTHDWVRDLPLRENMPSARELRLQMGEALTKASLPMDRSLVDLLRLDPLNSVDSLKRLVEQRMRMDLKLKGGILRDENSQRLLIPVQFSFASTDSERTQNFTKSLPSLCATTPGCKNLTLFGPHASTRENEMQIRQDVEVVSKVGTLALTLLCLFILFTRRYRLLSLLPLLGLAMIASGWITVLVFGKIHGITLAFGPGIIGLAMDYGIHACFLGARSNKTWRANWVGIWTTMVIMVILGFSAIPLLRQMMFFASLGLCLSYGLFYLCMRRWPHVFETRHYAVAPRPSRVLQTCAILFLVGAPLIFFLPVHLDVQHLNFESTKTVEVRNWFFGVAGSSSPFLVIENAAAPLESASQARAWARAHQVSYEGIANYLPTAAEQQAHLDSWKIINCGAAPLNFDATTRAFFSPFIASTACSALNPNALTARQFRLPNYLQDFQHDGNFVSLFFPVDPEQVRQLKQEYPAATTPREIFASFPQIFYNELSWMVPLAFLGAFFFLWLHYREWRWATMAIVPFLTGLGCYALVSVALHLPISFISLIGLLMVFGCSLDYGVFVMDFLLFRDADRPGVWSALSVCCFATVAGFAPLVFAQHPVLRDLGHALLWGSVGTYIGSLWGIPWIFKLAQRLRGSTPEAAR